MTLIRAATLAAPPLAVSAWCHTTRRKFRNVRLVRVVRLYDWQKEGWL